MRDLIEQLDSYQDHLDAAYPAVTVAEVLERSVVEPVAPVVPERSAWRGVVAFASAFVVVVAIGVSVYVVGSRDVSEPTSPTTVPTTVITTTTTAAETTVAGSIAEEAAIRAVDELHARWNAGDLDGVVALLGPEPRNDPGMASVMERAVVVLGAKLVAQCSDAVENVSGGFDVTCSVSLLDDHFYAVAGVSWTHDVVYNVTDEGINTPTGFFWNQGPTGDAYGFLREFDSWLFERDRGGDVFPGWVWVDPDNGLLPNWGDGRPCCMYSVESRSAAEALPDLIAEFLSDISRTDLTASEVVDGLTLRYYPEDETYNVISGERGGDVLFTLTQCPGECFAQDRILTRSPNGVLSTVGFQAAVWHVNEYGQTEITHLRPPDTPFEMDVLWLTDYTGTTRDTLTGFTPDASNTFTLHDELVLESRRDGVGLFALHATCQTDDVGAALVSFEGNEPAALIGWEIDYTTMRFTQVDDPTTIQIGSCYTPTPHP